MKLCPTCQHCYEDTDETCAREGHDPLVIGRPGETWIAEKYRLSNLLARGGMGTVYAGTHVELDRPVAIKLLRPDFNAETQALERFRREARIAAKIKHPNIADIYDYGSLSNGEAYIVMELVEGETLSERLRRVGQLSFAEAVSLSRQIAAGMEAAHRSGVVHRDLKPSNIILTRGFDGSVLVKIIDFGIAKISEQFAPEDSTLTATGMLVGTPRYMSPEQCLGRELDARSDIYSFGVIQYEMLAGQPPFDATSAVAIAYKHIHEPVPPLDSFRHEVPPLLASLITESLSVDPAGRPQTAEEIAHRLAEIEQSLGEYEAAGGVRRELSSQEEDQLKTQAFTQDSAVSVSTDAADEYATAIWTKASGVKDLAQSHLFTFGDKTIKWAIPLTPETLAAHRSETTGAPFAGKPAAQPGRSHPRSRLLVGLLALLITGAIVLWAALRKEEASNTGVPAPTASAAVSANREKPAGDARSVAAVPAETDAEDNSESVRAEIKGALEEWIAATNAGDVSKQMAFYNPTVEAFYRTRNVSREDVRAEKQRLFEQADRIEVEAGEPQITFSRDGQLATTRFRKRYVIEGEEENRQGEVLQELRWINTAGGWKIISERDLRVLRNSGKGAGRRNGNPSNRPDQVVVRGVKKLFQVIH